MLWDGFYQSEYLLFLIPAIVNITILLFLLPGLTLNTKSVSIKKRSEKVTILLPTYNDAKGVSQALESIENQSFHKKITVLVINDGSTDGSDEIIEKWISEYKRTHNYHHILLPENTGRKGLAMGQAVHLVPNETDVLVVMDGDTVLERDALRHCIEKLDTDEKLAAVCGMILPQKMQHHSFVERLQHNELLGAFHGIKYAQSQYGCVNTLAGALIAHKMSAIRDVGWFGEWLVEDVCWTWKARAMGWKVGFAEQALAFTECPQTMAQLWKQRRRWSRGRLEALKVAFSESKSNALYILPWFLYSLTQLFLLPGLIVSSLFNPLLVVLIMALLFSLHWKFAVFNFGKLKLKDNRAATESAIFSAILLDLFLIWPNAHGVWDEVVGSKKDWLTR